jgi:V8-like Glu-specific endopeptidase
MEEATRRRRPAAVVLSRGRRAERFPRSSAVMRRLGVLAVVSVAVAGMTLALSAVGRPASANASTNPTSTPSPSPSPNVARAFSGTAAVGALFITRKGGKLQHFCSAAVVRSPQEDLVVTAAHCIWGKTLGTKGGVIFGPGWHNGKFPKGRWLVMSAMVDSKWKKDKDPNDDVAFLVVRSGRKKIQRVTGAETLKTGTKLPKTVQVIGYPDSTSKPVKCTGPATALKGHRYLHQLVFDCDGFTGGTSGGPFLMRVSKSTGAGEVIGVIGGYQEGGVSPNVSYSSQFLSNVGDLYKQATS